MSLFVGHELEAVTFTANTVHLAFDSSLAVTIEAAFVVRLGSSEHETNAPPVRSSRLMTLVGHPVRLASAVQGNLTLHFEGGTLSVLEDSMEYECYRIYASGEEIVV